MKESKLIMLLESLSSDELRTFGNHLLLSNHSKSSSIYKLYSYLKKFHPNYLEKNVEKQIVFKKIMPKDKAYNDKSLRDLMSKITLSLENFLLQIELDSNEVEKDFMMLSLLKKRKRDKLFFQKITQIERKWKKDPTPGVEHYHHEFRLMKEYNTHTFTKLSKDDKVNNNDLIQKMDEYYFANKLYHTVCAIQIQNVLKSKFDLSNNVLIQEINNLKQSEHLSGNIHIDIFGHFFDAYSNENYENYFSIKELYFNQIQQYSEDEKCDLFLFLQHYCFENHRLGKEGFLRELFELNKFAVEQNFLKKDNSISTDIFRNIVQLGCAVEEFDWVAKFIGEYQIYLEEEKKQDIVSLCNAVLSFNQGNYEAALEKLLLVKYHDPLYAIHARCLQLQCYYELSKYEELFFNLVNSFSVFLSRNDKLADSTRQAIRKFVHFTHRFYKLKSTKDEHLNKVLKELEECVIVANKKWLLQKGTELIQKKKQFSS